MPPDFVPLTVQLGFWGANYSAAKVGRKRERAEVGMRLSGNGSKWERAVSGKRMDERRKRGEKRDGPFVCAFVFSFVRSSVRLFAGMLW